MTIRQELSSARDMGSLYSFIFFVIFSNVTITMSDFGGELSNISSTASIISDLLLSVHPCCLVAILLVLPSKIFVCLNVSLFPLCALVRLGIVS